MKTRTNPETVKTTTVQKPSSENTAQVPPPEEEDSIFIEIPKPKAKKTVNVEIQEPNSPKPTSYQFKLPYPERMKACSFDSYYSNDTRLANRSPFSYPMAIPKDVVVRVDGFTFLTDFVVVNFVPDPRVAIILGRPFLRTAKALIDFGSTTTHSDDPSPSSSTVKTSDNLEKFTDELTPLNSLPPGDDVMFIDLGDDIDENDAFLAIEISMDYEEGYYDSGGDVLFLESLLCEDTTHNFSSEVISDHDTSISFSPRSDPLHHEFAGEAITLPSRNDREFEEYLSLMTVLCEISTSRSQENVHANQSLIIESLPVSLIPVEDSDPVQEEIDIFLVRDDLIPPSDNSEDEDIELPNNDHQDDPSIPRPTPRTTDV
ncbi:reverse transcriptase domain-containing protein [Tanacetum coccineum]